MKRLGTTLLLLFFALMPILRLGAQGPDRDRDQRDRGGELQITRAIYGNGKRTMNVTSQLNAQIRDGRLRVPVRNETMGGDPARNKVKTLTVWYRFNGRDAQMTVNENDYLELPGGNIRDDDHGDDNRRNDNRGNDSGGQRRLR
jgi:hypothetical protein